MQENDCLNVLVNREYGNVGYVFVNTWICNKGGCVLHLAEIEVSNSRIGHDLGTAAFARED